MRNLIAILLLASTVGCASMRSTSLKRNDNDSYSRNCVPTKGVPVTVRVPTHLQLAVVETLYYYNDAKDSNVDLKLLPDELFQNKRNVKVKSNIIRTEKVMTVDMKRPAAGTLEYNLAFDPESQYITQIESFLYDRSISDTANLLATVVPGAEEGEPAPETATPGFDLKPATGDFRTTPYRFTQIYGSRPDPTKDSPVIGSKIAPKIMTKERVVAIAMFDINACDFEDQVRVFVEHHVNQCHDCASDACPAPAAPSQ